MEPVTDATVYVVDDDADVREALAWLLRSRRLLSECYRNAEEFEQAVLQTSPVTRRPCCLLLDMRMTGMSGLSLFNRMTEQFAEEYGCEPPQVTAQEAAQLLQAPWPGNVRQLINVAERAVLQNRRGSGSIASLLMADGEETQQATTTEGKPLKEYVESFEKMLIDNTMRRHKGSIAAVMDELCLPRRTLNEKMAKYGLSRGDYL